MDLWSSENALLGTAAGYGERGVSAEGDGDVFLPGNDGPNCADELGLGPIFFELCIKALIAGKPGFLGVCSESSRRTRNRSSFQEVIVGVKIDRIAPR